MLHWFNPLYSSTDQQQELFAIKVATIKITDGFYYNWKPSRAYHKINSFLVSKDEWDTKEGHEEYIVCNSMAKGTFWVEVTLKSKSVALAIVGLHKSEDIRQAVSQSVDNFIKYLFLKFHSNILKVFRKSKQYCPIII